MAVEICIPSRDGRFDEEVLTRVGDAAGHAARHGLPCEATRVVDRYAVAACRNRGVAGFLSRSAAHLLFVDDDVLLPAEAVVRLEELSRRTGGVACGSIPSVRIDAAGDVAPYVQIKPPGGDWLTTWPEGEVEAECCGGGCMLIPRAVLEALGFPWFRWPESYRPGGGVRAKSDDADFCERVRARGIPVWATGAVRCGHKKTLDVAQLIGR